jgi:diguanylate cyclase (GGDEF)-like protein
LRETVRDTEAGFDFGEFTSSSRLLCAITTRSGRVLWANDTLGRAFGPEGAAVVNRPFVELLDPYDRPPAVRELTRLDSIGDEAVFEARLHPVAGGFRATWSWRVGHDGLLYIVGIEADPVPVSLPAEDDSSTALHELVSLDHLTNTASRRAFDAALDRQLDRCRREGLPLSVALVDLDRFKHYNDTYGHLAGDQCLVTVAKALQRRASREGELVGRFGGDEFLILWPGIDLATAVRNAERLRETVRVLDLRLEGQPVEVSVSVGGITVVPTASTTTASLIHAADRAMYRVKAGGGDDTEWVTDPVEPRDAQAVASGP